MSEHQPSGPPVAPPGWYPTASGETRYWDGERWTDHVAPPAAAHTPVTGHPVYPPPNPTDSYAVQPWSAPAHHPQPYGHHPQVLVSPKNPGLALIASFFIPGLGQFINGEGAKGAMFLISYLVAWGFSLLLIGIPFLLGTWIWSMVDAWSTASSWNRARGIIS